MQYSYSPYATAGYRSHSESESSDESTIEDTEPIRWGSALNIANAERLSEKVTSQSAVLGRFVRKARKLLHDDNVSFIVNDNYQYWMNPPVYVRDAEIDISTHLKVANREERSRTVVTFPRSEDGIITMTLTSYRTSQSQYGSEQLYSSGRRLTHEEAIYLIASLLRDGL